MSNTYYVKNGLSLTAYVGKDEGMLQLTTANDYIKLNDDDALELALNILLRVNGHISATGSEEGICKD